MHLLGHLLSVADRDYAARLDRKVVGIIVRMTLVLHSPLGRGLWLGPSVQLLAHHSHAFVPARGGNVIDMFRLM